MAIYPITRVSVGYTFSSGTSSVINKARSIAPAGIETQPLALPIVVDKSLAAASLDFQMTVGVIAQTGSSVRFTFSGAIVQPNITIGSQLRFGLVKAVTVDSFNPIGIASPLAGTPIVFTGNSTLFDIDFASTTYELISSKNIPFHFGGILISNVGIGDNLVIAKPTLTNALNIRPTGVSLYGTGFGQTLTYIAYSSGYIDIDMNTPNRHSYGRFNFGGASPVTNVGLLNQGAIGSAKLTSSAAAIRPASINSYGTGSAITHPTTDRGFRANDGVLNISFLENIKPSNALNIGFYFWLYGQASLKGIDSLQFGLPEVSSTLVVVKPSTWLSSSFGDHTVQTLTSVLSVFGVRSSSEPSQPLVENYARVLSGYGIKPPSFSKHGIYFRLQDIGYKNFFSQEFGELTITHGVRSVYTVGANNDLYGEQWVSLSPRLITVSPIEPNGITAPSIGNAREILPEGYTATLFGSRIIPDSTSLYPQGFSEEWGLSDIKLWVRYAAPVGFISVGTQPADRWGWVAAYNRTQYIKQRFIGDSGLVPPAWSDWTAIENRNKTIGAIGTNHLRFGYSQIDNNAELLKPKSIAPPITTRDDWSLIAYRIRTLPLDGIESPMMSGWGVVHNSARVIQPSSYDALLVGNSILTKNRRYYDRVGGVDSLEAGVPMTSHRIRKVDIEKRHSIAPPIIRLPTIDLYTRYVDLRGYETAKYGLASLSIHFRIVTPRWSHSEKFGYPALHNVTPQLLAKGHDSQEYGITNIRTEWRIINAQGDNTQLFGGLKISDTEQGISNKGWISTTASQKHTVTKTNTKPNVTQHIWLNNESDNTSNGFGIPFDSTFFLGQVPKPLLNQNVLYAVGIDSFKAGKTGVHSNNLQITAGIAIDGVSKGARVYTSAQTINLSGMKEIDSEIAVGRPRLSPHTIWAVMEAPQQAKDNHPLPDGKNYHYVDQEQLGLGGNDIGKAFVESTIRTIYQRENIYPTNSIVGSPDIVLKKTIVKAQPFRSARFGVPSIPFTLQAITVRLGISSRNLSVAAITRPPYVGPQLISAIGLIATRFGSTYSDNFMRNIYPSGANTQSFGRSKPNDNPYMWQGLRVGEHVPTSIGAGDTSSYGNTVVSLRIRELGAEGFDAFISRYELESFSGRMTVRNTDQQLPQIRQINITGIKPNSTAGYQDIKLGQHYIRPDGNSEQFRKGGYHA